MNINKLITLLQKAKNDGVREVKILRETDNITIFSAEDISGFTISNEYDYLTLIPEYIY